MLPAVLLALPPLFPSSLTFFLTLFLSLYATHIVLLCYPTHNISINSNPKSRIKPHFFPKTKPTFFIQIPNRQSLTLFPNKTPKMGEEIMGRENRR
ncbi:hypothetical protein AMTRI_Chr01g109710 [Amborella trichopoda]